MSILTKYQDLLSGGDISAGEDFLKSAGSGIRALNAPDLTDLIPILQLQVMQGQMTAAQMQAAIAGVAKMSPAQMEAAIQEASMMAGVQTNQGTLANAAHALAQLRDLADNGGMSAADTANLNSLMTQTNADRASQLQAVVQKMNQQGMGGSGVETAARLASAQTGANSNAAAGASAALAAQQRALDAMKTGVSGSTTLNQQLFEQEASKAKAQDEINRANAAARQAANLQSGTWSQEAAKANQTALNANAEANAQRQQQANLNNANWAQDANKTNFTTANEIAGKNIGITNEQLKMPYTAAQHNWNNQLDQQKAAAAAQTAAAEALLGQGNKNATNSASAIGNTVDALGRVWNAAKGIWEAVSSVSDERLKTDKKKLSDKEADDMLGKLTGYKYRYKGPNGNPAVVGVMAQDMEKGGFDSVVDTPAGKVIQKPETLNSVLALMGKLHERMLRLEGNK